MFYANFILKKRGPLSRIWLAAHWDKKLTKAHIFETDIEGSVEAILSPKLKLALRTSSHLLLGVVRIYSRKTKYLLADCNEAFVKIKLAFRPGIVDLPAENLEAALTAINIREDFTSFDLEVIDFNDIDLHTRFAVNQSRPEDITIREEVSSMPFMGDDGFVDDDDLGGPMTIEEANKLLEMFEMTDSRPPYDIIDCCAAVDEMVLQENGHNLSLLMTPAAKMKRNASLADSGFGSPSLQMSDFCSSAGGGSGNFLDDSLASKFLDSECASGNCPTVVPITATTLVHITNPDSANTYVAKTAIQAGSLTLCLQGSGDFGFNPGVSAIPEVNLDDIFGQNMDQAIIEPNKVLLEQETSGNGAAKGKGTKDIEPEGRESQSLGDEGNYDGDDGDDCDDYSLDDGFGQPVDHKLFYEEQAMNEDGQLFDKGHSRKKVSVNEKILIVSGSTCGDEEPVCDSVHSPKPHESLHDLTTLVENDAEVFALRPIELQIKERKTKRKRRLIIDEYKVISSETMKGQLSDSSDLNVSLDLAPPSKRLMHWKETGGVDKLFALPGRPLINKILFKLFSRNLITRHISDDHPQSPSAAATIAELENGKMNDETRTSEVMRESVSEMVTESTDFLNEILFSPIVDKDDHRPSTDILPRLDPSSSFLSQDDDALTAADETISVAVDIRDSSPQRKRQRQSSGSMEPNVPLPSLPDLPLPDFDDGDNDDAIFDVEVAPSCSERTNLRQELDEAELEERLWNKRSTHMQELLQRKLEITSVVDFRQLTCRNNRKQAASKFYTILVLTKAQAICVEQQEPYGNIQISRGPTFSGIG